MKRLLLMGACVALALGSGSASADTTTIGCGAGLGAYNAAQCVAPGTLTVADGDVIELRVDVAIGPIEDHFNGDIRVVLESMTGRYERTCVHRATGLFTQTCLEDFQGDWTDPVATCKGTAAGIGEWAVSCSVTSAQ